MVIKTPHPRVSYIPHITFYHDKQKLKKNVMNINEIIPKLHISILFQF